MKKKLTFGLTRGNEHDTQKKRQQRSAKNEKVFHETFPIKKNQSVKKQSKKKKRINKINLKRIL